MTGSDRKNMQGTQQILNLLKTPEQIDSQFLEGRFFMPERYIRNVLAFAAEEKNKDIVKIRRTGRKTPEEISKLEPFERELNLPFSVIIDTNRIPHALYEGKAKAVGKGQFGTVKIAQNLQTGEFQVSKTQEFFSEMDVRLAEVKNETEFLSRTGHLKGHQVRKVKKQIGTEIAEGYKHYTFQSHFKGHELSLLISKKLVSDDSKIKIMKSLLSEAEIMHRKHKILHRDLKPANIICNAETGETLIIDFGTATNLTEKPVLEHIGNEAYRAPEVFDHGSTEKSDIYALGLILKKLFYSGDNKNPLIKMIAQELDMSLSNPDPEKRFSWEQVPPLVSNLEKIYTEYNECIMNPSHKNLEKLSELLKLDIFKNAVKKDTSIADDLLEVALKTKNLKLLKLCFDNNINFNNKDKNGLNALARSIADKNLAFTKAYLDNSGLINEVAPSDDPNIKLSLLEVAVNANNKEAIALLIKHGEDINKLNVKDLTPLQLATSNGNYELAQFLTESGADINKKNSQNETAFSIAFSKQDYEMCALLAMNQTIISADYLTASIKSEREYRVEFLLQCGVKPELRDTLGNTALSMISEFDPDNPIRIMVEIGQKEILASPDQLGQTTLMTNITAGNRYQSLMLLKNEANPNHQDNNGNTPLLLAIKNKKIDLEVIKALLKSGADPNITNNNHQSAFDLAKESGDILLQEFLDTHKKTLKISTRTEDKANEIRLQTDPTSSPEQSTPNNKSNNFRF